MDYTPHTRQEIEQMLETIGVGAIEELFEPIPQNVRLQRDLDLPPAMTESEVMETMAALAGLNVACDRLACFAGGGAYDHYIPAVVKALAGRSEFVTSYTPYQPELSQGVLGALFDYQSLVCELTGMEVSNAGLYDGASALTEAVGMTLSSRAGKGGEQGAGHPAVRRVVVSEALNPNYRAVLETMGPGMGYEVRTAPAPSGLTDLSDLDEADCVIVAQPNFYGCIEDLEAAGGAAHSAGASYVVHYDLLSAGVLESPGALGADVVTAEGQSLGNNLNFGGPYLGVFAARMEHVRRMPGRICGKTLDVHGKPGYVLTFQTREQHIRRERATSNVCTDQTLMAVAAAVYLSWLGPRGLEEVGLTCAARAAYAASLLCDLPDCSLRFDAPFFKEFVLKVPGPAVRVAAALGEKGHLVGPCLTGPSGELEDCLLVAVTERRTMEEIDRLAKDLAEVLA